MVVSSQSKAHACPAIELAQVKGLVEKHGIKKSCDDSMNIYSSSIHCATIVMIQPTDSRPPADRVDHWDIQTTGPNVLIKIEM